MPLWDQVNAYLCLELPRLTNKDLDLSNVEHMALTVHIRSIPEGFALAVRLYSLHFISFRGSPISFWDVFHVSVIALKIFYFYLMLNTRHLLLV